MANSLHYFFDQSLVWIPLSILTSIAVLHALGQMVNTMVGILVDDSTIAIAKRYEKTAMQIGKSPFHSSSWPSPGLKSNRAA